jgi:hypothetical protein
MLIWTRWVKINGLVTAKVIKPILSYYSVGELDEY